MVVEKEATVKQIGYDSALISRAGNRPEFVVAPTSSELYWTGFNAYCDGATPEEIVLRYDSLSLSDVYGVIAYYLRNRAAVDAYVAERDRIGNENERQARSQQQHDLAHIRARMEARRNR